MTHQQRQQAKARRRARRVKSGKRNRYSDSKVATLNTGFARANKMVRGLPVR